MESFVAIMALVAACVIEPGIYYAMNSPAAVIGTTPDQVAQVVSSWGFVITPADLVQTAKDVGEHHHLARRRRRRWPWAWRTYCTRPSAARP